MIDWVSVYDSFIPTRMEDVLLYIPNDDGSYEICSGTYVADKDLFFNSEGFQLSGVAYWSPMIDLPEGE